MAITQTNKTVGFTIVELLIVVVVIAILAAVTIVSYNGIQQKARITSIVTESGNWKESFQLYYTSKGSYPAFSTTDDVICLTESFPPDDRFSSNTQCTSGTALPSSQDAAFKSSLAQLAKVNPSANTAPVFYSRYGRVTTYVRGIIYDKYLNAIVYALPGENNSCGQGKTPDVNGISLGGIINPKVATVEDNPGLTLCYIELDD